MGDASNIKGLTAGAIGECESTAGANYSASAIRRQFAYQRWRRVDQSRRVARSLSQRDFQLAAHDAPLAKIAAETGGRHGDLFSAMDVLPRGFPERRSRRQRESRFGRGLGR